MSVRKISSIKSVKNVLNFIFPIFSRFQSFERDSQIINFKKTKIQKENKKFNFTLYVLTEQNDS